VCFEGSGKLLTDKFDGLIVENGNTDAMADAIIEILQNRDLRENLGKNARQTLVGMYDWISLCKRLEGVYSKILGYSIMQG
jgi:1,2-diacylglycerol 3-alpha-glucosyltransferase